MKKLSEMFDQWNTNKKQLQTSNKHLKTNIGEIRMYKVGINLGNEASKNKPFMRPCIIINHVGGDLILVIPLTSNNYNRKYCIHIPNPSTYGLSRTSYALINQIKSISKKRLIFKINAIKKGGKRIKLIKRTTLENIKSEYTHKVFKI